ncbi:MAG: hypothetical protein PHC70_02145 [Patescibacteria group bacterium]|nr:hypothetical protein [Patescibacteria group bacterium]
MTQFLWLRGWGSNPFLADERLTLEADWQASTNSGSRACGQAPKLQKNILFIGQKLGNLWEKGVRPPSLDKLCDSILSEILTSTDAAFDEFKEAKIKEDQVMTNL